MAFYAVGKDHFLRTRFCPKMVEKGQKGGQSMNVSHFAIPTPVGVLDSLTSFESCGHLALLIVLRGQFPCLCATPVRSATEELVENG